MFFLVPIVYVFGGLISALVISALRRVVFWKAFLLSLLFTPLFGGIIAMYLKARPKAYCMSNYMHFEVGYAYPYREVDSKKGKQIWVYSDQIYRMTPKTFNKHFSYVVNQEPPPPRGRRTHARVRAGGEGRRDDRPHAVARRLSRASCIRRDAHGASGI